MNEMKPEDVMMALECCVSTDCGKCQLEPIPKQHGWAVNCVDVLLGNALALLREKDTLLAEWDAKCKDYETDLLGKCMDIEKLRAYCDEKDAEIERLIKERDEARRDVAVAEQNHYDCKKELEEMSDDILDSVRAERDRYKAESKKYQSAMLEKGAEIERLNNAMDTMLVEHQRITKLVRADAITEFAERLMGRFNICDSAKYSQTTVHDVIAHIAKEMKGEQQ